MTLTKAQYREAVKRFARQYDLIVPEVCQMFTITDFSEFVSSVDDAIMEMEEELLLDPAVETAKIQQEQEEIWENAHTERPLSDRERFLANFGDDAAEFY